MSGKIKSEYNKIYFYPPDSPVCYLAELQKTDHIRVWVIKNGQHFPTEYIPFEIVPYMDVLVQRRRKQRQHALSRTQRCYDVWSDTLEAETCASL